MRGKNKREKLVKNTSKNKKLKLKF